MPRHSHTWTPLYLRPADHLTPENADALMGYVLDRSLGGLGDYLGCECGAVALRSRHSLHRVRVCHTMDWARIQAKAEEWNEQVRRIVEPVQV